MELIDNIKIIVNIKIIKTLIKIIRTLKVQGNTQ